MRRTKDVTIPGTKSDRQGERDNGKTFRITEMSAFDAERWASRVTIALAPRLSREVSPEMAAEVEDNPGMGSMGRIFALLGGISFPELEPFLDAIMDCIQIIPGEGNIMPRPLRRDWEDIEEPETISLLKWEAMNLHLGFTFAASLLRLAAITSTMSIWDSMQTSREPSEPPSAPELPRSTNSRRSTAART
jgi:hypothetical protein